MAFGIRKFKVRTQIRDASQRAPRRLSLVQQRRIGSGVSAPKSSKGSRERFKAMLRGNKVKGGVGR